MSKRSLPIAVIVFAVGCNDQSQRIAELENHNRELESKLAAGANQAPLSAQKTCATQAKEYLRNYEFPEGGRLLYSMNHYNTRLKRCLVRFAYTTGPPGHLEWYNERLPPYVEVAVADAFEGKTYASYGDSLPTRECRVIVFSTEEETNCRNEFEFYEFIKPYMEQ